MTRQHSHDYRGQRAVGRRSGFIAGAPKPAASIQDGHCRWGGWSTLGVSLTLAAAFALGSVQAGTVYLPNGSFESPSTAFVDPRIDGWQKSPKPFWYDESGGFFWDQLTGLFLNTPPGDASHIDNCDGSQAIFLFAVPEVALFQDYLSTDWSHPTPSREFDAKFRTGRSYRLTVGVAGGGGNMTNGVTLELSLYYRDAASNRVTVAATTITNSSALFTNTTHLLDFAVAVPAVKATDAWAGQNIGVQLLSTVRPDLAGGYWDVDNVRLTESIEVPNASFELPSTAFADPRVDYWQKTPKPFWYDESGGYFWDQLTGVFANTAPGSADRIENCDGNQAVWLFAVPEVGMFQDYDSVYGTNSSPAHDFDVKYEVGRAYHLTVGVFGGGGNMQEGVSLQAALYYRDAASNRVAVAATDIVYTAAQFTNAQNQRLLVDFQASTPVVQADDPWAGKPLGIQFLSTVEPSKAGGYWDLDRVRLTETSAPIVAGGLTTNGQFSLSLRGDPGQQFEIVAAPILSGGPGTWTTLARVTNVTGRVNFTDSEAAGLQRFYQARQVP